jgi:hypothetical protein
MLARSLTVGLLATLALPLPLPLALPLPADPAPYFTVESTGALSLAVTSPEARFGLLPDPDNGRPVLELSLGAQRGGAALLLFTYADEPLRPGRYPVASSLPEQPFAGRRFHPCFIAGTVEHPRGFFHGEIGWVTITAVEAGRISGAYEMRARGMLASDTTDEDQWVTIRGTFAADGDSTITSVRAVSAATR